MNLPYKKKRTPVRESRSCDCSIESVVICLRQVEVTGVLIASVDADVLCGKLSHQTLPCCGLGREDGFTCFLTARVRIRRRRVQPCTCRKGRPALASDSTFLITWHRSPLPSVEHNASRYQPTRLVTSEPCSSRTSARTPRESMRCRAR